ncbi:MAG: DUF111 family protein [Proteobacteria bacterium]|nr:DUF111 family protein [Pseudomonadota bacterium]
MEKKRALFLFQIDHLSGEEVGYMVNQLYGWGAKNVNVIATLTKKNRPGHLILVDTGCMDKEGLLEKMARCFGTCGCHRIDTTHLYLGTRSQSISLAVRSGERLFHEEVEIKIIEDQNGVLSRRLEYESLVSLCERLEKTLGFDIPFSRLRRRLEKGVGEGDCMEISVTLEEGRDG